MKSPFPHRAVLALLLLTCMSGPVSAHVEICHTPADAPRVFPFGEPGDYAVMTRTIKVSMRDMSFEPTGIKVKTGESIRFVLTNISDVEHDFTIGDAVAQTIHRKEMEQAYASPGEHAHYHYANSIHVPAHERRVLIWTFSHPGNFEYDCNMPGHYQAGMRGRVTVE